MHNTVHRTGTSVVRYAVRAKPLAALASQRDNNFNLIRVLAAALVILGHSYALTSHGGREPFIRLTGIDSGSWAVDIFFIISGFLVAKSYLGRPDPVNFTLARVLRIYPGLLVAVFSSVFLVGLLFTTLPKMEYLRTRQTWEYLVLNGTLLYRFVDLTYDLPGVFQSNPWGPAVNGSLWTLPFEVWMYIGLLVLGVVGVLRRRWAVNVLFAGMILVAVGHQVGMLGGQLFTSPYLPLFERFVSFFGWGVIFFVNRDRIPLNGLVAAGLMVLTALLWQARVTVPLLFPPALAYIVFWLAYVPAGFLRKYNRLGDYSYGVYIYAFPIQQSVVALLPKIEPLALAALALPLTLIPAVLSWHFVEKRALRQKDRLTARLPVRGSEQPPAGTKPR